MREAKQAGSWILVHSLINPDHTCSLYLPKEILQTSSFPLLILQAIMIFCGRLSFHAVLLTAYPRSGRLRVWLRGARRSAAPADLVIPPVCVFVVMSSVTTARSRCDFTDEWKVITRQLVQWALPERCRVVIKKFQRRLSYFQMGTRQRFPVRGCVGVFSQKIATLCFYFFFPEDIRCLKSNMEQQCLCVFHLV